MTTVLGQQVLFVGVLLLALRLEYDRVCANRVLRQQWQRFGWGCVALSAAVAAFDWWQGGDCNSAWGTAGLVLLLSDYTQSQTLSIELRMYGFVSVVPVCRGCCALVGASG